MSSKLINSIKYSITSMIIESVNESVKKAISKSVTSKIEAYSFNEGYWIILDVLSELDKESFLDNSEVVVDEEFGNKSRTSLMPGTSYVVKLDLFNYIVVKNIIDPRGGLVNILTIEFVGKDHKYNKRKFISILRKRSGRHDMSTIMTTNDMSGNHSIISHGFDRIVLSKEVRRRIIYGLYNWYKSKDWYNKNRLVHKIGVLLYGNPGTGKTTICRAISKMFGNAPILTITHTNDLKESIRNLIYFRKRYKGIIIVLFEDFDLFFKDIDGNKRNSSIQHTLFQMLDGMYSTEDTIYIGTTNHIDDLDPAIRRYGRFDIQEEITEFDRDRAIEFLKMFGYDKSLLPKEESDTYNPAKLQSLIMEVRAKEMCEKKIE